MFQFTRLFLVILTLCAFIPTSISADVAPADPVAVQLYIFGSPAQKPGEPLKEVLNTVRESGYHQVQAWLNYYESEESAETLQALLDEYDLKMVAAYTGGNMHEAEKAKEAIETILQKAKIGAKHGLEIVVLNPDTTPEPKTEKELKVQAENLNRLGATLSEMGLVLAIHQHDKEMKNDANEWYHILENTDPDKVTFCLDTHWVLRGGQDPYQLTKDAAPRIADLHLRNSIDGAWSESLGDGDIDYERIAKILDAEGFNGYLTVELAHEKETVKTKSLLENLKDSRAFVKEVFGK